MKYLSILHYAALKDERESRIAKLVSISSNTTFALTECGFFQLENEIVKKLISRAKKDLSKNDRKSFKATIKEIIGTMEDFAEIRQEDFEEARKQREELEENEV